MKKMKKIKKVSKSGKKVINKEKKITLPLEDAIGDTEYVLGVEPLGDVLCSILKTFKDR